MVAQQFPLAGKGGFVVGAWHGVMELELLEANPPGAAGFEIGLGAHRLQQAARIAEWLETVLSGNGGEIPGCCGFEGLRQTEIGGGWRLDAEVLTIGG